MDDCKDRFARVDAFRGCTPKVWAYQFHGPHFVDYNHLRRNHRPSDPSSTDGREIREIHTVFSYPGAHPPVDRGQGSSGTAGQIPDLETDPEPVPPFLG